MTNVTESNQIPLVLTFHSFNFKVRDIIRKNFHILKNDPETSPIFSNNPLVSFRHSKNIRETLVHSNLHQQSSPLSGTFPCGVAQCRTPHCHFGIQIHLQYQTQISRALPPISFTVHPAVDVACFTLECSFQPVARHFKSGTIAFQT